MNLEEARELAGKAVVHASYNKGCLANRSHFYPTRESLLEVVKETEWCAHMVLDLADEIESLREQLSQARRLAR